jgi:hypothetical protein
MFDAKSLYNYVAMIGLIMLAGYFSDKFKTFFEPKDDQYELIRKYLLNESPLYGYNKTKMWIHSKYELNARSWKSFHSRSSTDLNQPYLHLTIKTIINQCSDDFHICLIDDDSFSKLIPDWDVNLSGLPEPMKEHMRELALSKLLYIYGGMIVPNSFVCCKNLKGLYDQGIIGDKPFMCEAVNRNENINTSSKSRLAFKPNAYFMGANKNNAVIRELIEYLKQRNSNQHFSSEMEFLGDTSEWALSEIHRGKMNLIGGELIGIKTKDRKSILIEDLVEEKFLALVPDYYGVYIPGDDFLTRTKYQWFPALSSQEILKSNMAISKYIVASMVDDYKRKENTEIKSVLTI